jgi:hypothetical protein
LFSVQDLSREPDVDKLASRVQEVRQETDGETDEDEDRDKDGEDGETDGDEDGDGDVGRDQDGVKGGDEDRDKDGEDGETDGDEDGDVGRDQDGVKDGDEDEVDGGEHVFLQLLVNAYGKNQVRGQYQEAFKGKFKGKTMEELSWRGIIHLWYEKNGTMVCECDGNKAKNTDWAMIRHLEGTAHDLRTGIPFVFVKP